MICLYTKKLHSSMLHTSSSKLVIFMRLQQDQPREAGLQQLRTNQLPKSKNNLQTVCQLVGSTPDIDTCQLDHHTHTLSTNSIHITSLDYGKTSHSNAYTMVSSGSPQIMSCMSLVCRLRTFVSSMWGSLRLAPIIIIIYFAHICTVYVGLAPIIIIICRLRTFIVYVGLAPIIIILFRAHLYRLCGARSGSPQLISTYDIVINISAMHTK